MNSFRLMCFVEKLKDIESRQILADMNNKHDSVAFPLKKLGKQFTN